MRGLIAVCLIFLAIGPAAAQPYSPAMGSPTISGTLGGPGSINLPTGTIAGQALTGNASAATATANGIANPLSTWMSYLSGTANPNPTYWQGTNAGARTVTGNLVGVSADAGVSAASIYGGGGGGICSSCITYDAFRAVVRAQAGSTITATNAGAFYVSNQNPVAGNNQNAVAVFMAATGEVNNAHTWAFNSTVQDCLGYSICSVTGVALIGGEMDFTALSTGTTLQAFGLLGSSLVQPEYAQGPTCGSLSVQSMGLAQWTHCFVSLDGVAINALYIGATEQSGTNIPSQTATWNYFDAGGVEQAYTMYVNAAGGFSFNCSASSPASCSLGTNGSLVATSFNSESSGRNIATEVGTVMNYASSAGTTNVSIGNGTAQVSLTGPTKLQNAASWVAATNCGSLSSSTKCLAVVDPNGNTMYLPAYGTF